MELNVKVGTEGFELNLKGTKDELHHLVDMLEYIAQKGSMKKEE